MINILLLILLRIFPRPYHSKVQRPRARQGSPSLRCSSPFLSLLLPFQVLPITLMISCSSIRSYRPYLQSMLLSPFDVGDSLGMIDKRKGERSLLQLYLILIQFLFPMLLSMRMDSSEREATIPLERFPLVSPLFEVREG